jgi:hypothetical protein
LKELAREDSAGDLVLVDPEVGTLLAVHEGVPVPQQGDPGTRNWCCRMQMKGHLGVGFSPLGVAETLCGLVCLI